MKPVLTALTLFACLNTAHAVIVYTADFSNAGEGATHSGSGTFAAGSVVGTNWSTSWPNVATDGTLNSFITAGGVMTVDDWGGDGTLTSETITFTWGSSRRRLWRCTSTT